MKKILPAVALTLSMATLAPVAQAQNVAIVNGKAVPKARVEALAQQLARSGRPVTPDVEAQIKEEVIAREIFMQEAQKRGLDASEDFKGQMELARQTILIRELFADEQKKNPVTDADILEPSEAFRRQMDYYAHAPGTAATLERLAAEAPATLACMHGSAWRGDGAGLLRALAPMWRWLVTLCSRPNQPVSSKPLPKSA